MNKRSTIFSLLIMIALVCSAQVPQKFNYQAVVRNAQHALIANQDVGFKMSILEGSLEGDPVYVETHAEITNAIGLADLVIGEGTATSGVFEEILWGSTVMFLKVEVDPTGGSAYEYLGTSQLISVPYALYSGNLSSPTRKFTVQEEMGHPVDSALFEVRNAEGQTVFAVYPEGTRVYVLDEEAKGVKGGFAIGGYSRKAKGITQEYMRVTPDSIRMYFDEEATKGVKGGFAIGGYSRNTKGLTDQYFTLKPDSAKFLMVSDNPDVANNSALTVNTKSRFGGDGGDDASLFRLTRDNYFMGHKAGSSITSATHNCFIGYESGLSTTIGHGNVFIGQFAGRENTEGEANLFIGTEAGQFNTTGDLNTGVGFQAGYGTTTGNYNSIFGFWAGYENQGGDLNTYFGAHAGHMVRNGNSNTYIGAYTGSEKYTGIQNTFVGMRAGSWVGSDFNTIIGSNAGSSDNDGNNVFVGAYSGIDATGGYNTYLGDHSGANNHGNNNTFVGYAAGDLCIDGSQNVYIGANSGRGANGQFNAFLGTNAGGNSNGDRNTFIGHSAGNACTDGINNVFVGAASGENNNGAGNVFIGNFAGSNTQGSDMLVIDNQDSDSTNSLIWGLFDQDILRINNRLGVGMNTDEAYALSVNGEAYKEGNSDWSTTSDRRVKTGIRTIEGGLERIMKLRPVTYRYTDEWRNNNPGINDQEYYHYIAQEFAEVFPESVHRGPESLEGESESLLRMNSQPAQVVSIRAIQELAEQNREQQVLLEELQKQISVLKRTQEELLDYIRTSIHP